MAVAITINSLTKTTVVEAGSAGPKISYTLGSRGTAQLRTAIISDSPSTAYRPAVDHTLSIADGAVTLFNGWIISATDQPITEPNDGVRTSIDASDYTSVCDDRIVTKSYPAGQTLKQIVTDLRTTYLNAFGVTLDAGMANGPTMGAWEFDGATLTEVLNRLGLEAGYIWRITPAKVLEMFVPGTKSASYSLTADNGKVIGGVKWTKTRRQFTNRVFLYFGEGREVKTEGFTGTGSQTTFPLTYTLGPTLPGYLTLAGVFVGINTSWTITNNAIVFNTAPANGAAISITYTAEFPDSVMVEDATSVSAIGPREKRFHYPDIFDLTEATTLANALLDRYSATDARVVTIRTREGLALPGDSITITISDRLLSGSWMITAVSMTTGVDGRFVYDLTCAEGVALPDSWQQEFKRIVGTSSGTASTLSGSLYPTASGHFNDDVVAHSTFDSTGNRESALTNYLNASLEGPAVRLGRLGSTFEWAVTADYLAGSPATKRLRFTPLGDSPGTYRYALQLSQDTTPTAGVYYLTHNGSGGGSLYLGAPTSIFGTGFRITGGYFTDFDVTNGFTERGRTVKAGEWTSVAFNAGNFTATGSMTWTVDSGDQVALAYTLIGKTMIVTFQIDNTDVGGTASNVLQITVPGGFTVARSAQGSLFYNDAGSGFLGGGVTQAAVGTTVIQLAKTDLSNWTLTTNDDTSVRGTIVFEMQ